MTHHQVLVFGSFTEDEIKSLQIQPTESDRTIKFGSLDSETLKSVGIFSTIPKKSENSTGSRPAKLLHNESTLNTVCTTEKVREVISTCIDENGSNHDLWPAQCSDSVIELQQNDVKPSLPHVSVTVSDPQNHSSPKQLSTESSSSSSKPVVDEAFFDSSEGFEVVDPKEISCDASNEPGATAKNLRPRGLVNLGNLCFLNATLQALLCCSPFVQLLLELRTRNIPLIGYPTLRAFVDFISEFEIPCNSSSKKKQTFVLETGSPLRPVMFEIVLKIFSPDVSDSLSGRPRQEDAQEFLSYIMHQMHDELLKLDGQSANVTGGKPSLVNSMNDEDDGDSWETVGPKNRTAITRTQSFIPSELSATFGGQLRSVVKARGIRGFFRISSPLSRSLEKSQDNYSPGLSHFLETVIWAYYLYITMAKRVYFYPMIWL
ncbi:hypothetical protein RJ639_038430 [Escallonia herrerae]|uniref:ubiquitinyl hydrolase 1 n=1 Tax=Escallonia herrerae TaxID=1293975 RepID=A0AA88WLB1_9ASTE|nr:hypothetical protein RJ639_038430 [Escallonia herrerae]